MRRYTLLLLGLLVTNFVDAGVVPSSHQQEQDRASVVAEQEANPSLAVHEHTSEGSSSQTSEKFALPFSVS